MLGTDITPFVYPPRSTIHFVGIIILCPMFALPSGNIDRVWAVGIRNHFLFHHTQTIVRSRIHIGCLGFPRFAMRS
ncbi:uncharacterized protein BP01DRAFT_359545 [Aspergillus saccharolyticus JOP 1030-1]|uniref:Uncharacterized protein n=1 Tax=Aspergillus saccharolyticus JOP 1030-1 TaxID=1450539 RepID=A0A318Z4N4_9EURO|nr:hypothetical protein BP01DRAFT_359545 [Aspergillus saccharolyticus JOP 1030-1]PYH42281.1 hypothetical protein BP01DRAFT_359545 [Aspergillus saccharolyticus JOP 1030-1]